MQLLYHKRFEKSFRKLSPSLQIKARNTLSLFLSDPSAKVLNRHKLKGKFKGLESINVTGDIRILLNPLTNEIVEIVEIGSHSQLY